MRNLDHVGAFVAVADAGGFAAAARHLGLSAQAVQKAVANMEAELGLRLLARTPRARVMTLTEAGAAYLEGCRRVLAAVEGLKGTLSEHRDEPGGPLRVVMPSSLGRLLIVPALGGFLDRHRDISVAALLTDRVSDPADEGADVVFRTAEQVESRMPFQVVAVPAVRISASPAYLERRGTPRALADLEAGGHDCISSVSPITGRRLPWRLRGADGQPREHSMQGRLAVADNCAELAAAIAGLGLVQLPDHIAGRALATGELIEILPEQRHEGPPISIGRHPDRKALPKVQAFVDYFTEWFKSGTGGATGPI